MKKNYNKRSEKDYGLLRSIYYQLFVVFVAIPVFKLFYNLKVEGRENVPKESRVIYAGNHVSYLDPPMLSYAVHKRVAYMAKQELFTDKNKLLRFLVHSLGAFAVNREKPELATFKTVKAVFNTPWSLSRNRCQEARISNLLREVYRNQTWYIRIPEARPPFRGRISRVLCYSA